MPDKNVLSLILILCLALLAASCGEGRGEKDEDEDEKPAAAASVTPLAAMPSFGKPVVYNFDADPTGKPPTHFTFARTGEGTEGAWVVKDDPTAPSKPNVLAQTSTDMTDYRFPLAILEKGNYKDLAVSVKFQAVRGKVDQAAGIVFRYQDPNNYYVVRANALEDNYNLYYVVAGRRHQSVGANFRVTPNEWHTLRVEAAGNVFKCYYDGALKITATDDTFPGAGKIGLWTKADSVTYFDDFEVPAP